LHSNRQSPFSFRAFRSCPRPKLLRPARGSWFALAPGEHHTRAPCTSPLSPVADSSALPVVSLHGSPSFPPTCLPRASRRQLIALGGTRFSPPRRPRRSTPSPPR